MTASPLSRYQEVDVLTMHPAQRVVFLYTQVLACLHQARALYAAGQREEWGKRLLRAQDIVNELYVSLDFEQGGQIAASLAALYDYWLRELTALSIRHDDARHTRLVGLVGEMHGAWAKAAAEVMSAPSTVAQSA